MSTVRVEDNRVLRWGSFLLGNFAAIWGFVVAPLYLIAFGILLPQVQSAGHSGLILPPTIPLVGVVLAALGLALSEGPEAEGAVAGRIGLALNVIPLVLAVALWWMRAVAP
jgi:hypothetical protein